MQEIKISAYSDVAFAAIGFQNFREKVKQFLIKNDSGFDKFTITNNDAFLGYISEYALKKYISQKYKSVGLSVCGWAAFCGFDIANIKTIVEKESPSKEEVDLVRRYFYDKFDLVLTYNKKNLFLDVKTAETKREPSPQWEFLYPIVQSGSSGKDYVVLCYYIKNSNEILDWKKFVLAGYMDMNTIKKCPIQTKGTKTHHNTTSQIDNYITIVADYRPLDELICRFILESMPK